MRCWRWSTGSRCFMAAPSWRRARRRPSSGRPPSPRSIWGSRPMPDAPLLDVRALDAFYGDFQALFGVSIAVAPRQVVAIIGANGAGKSTLLKSIAGLMPARRDAILFEGQPIGDLPAHKVVGRGIALVPEGRKLFASLSTEENLLIGGQLRRPGPWTLDRIYALFPA